MNPPARPRAAVLLAATLLTLAAPAARGAVPWLTPSDTPAAADSGAAWVSLDPDSIPPLDPAAVSDSLGGIDYLWVLRSAIATPAGVDSVVARAKAMGVRALLVQVVGRGDAFYRSDLLPRAELLADLDRRALVPPGGPLGRAVAERRFDPLAAVVDRAHSAGIEVHAWVNCLLVWSAPRAPRDPRHVVHEHPEWVASLTDGRPLTRLGRRELDRRGIEGVFLSPAAEGVRGWVAGIAREIASRYAVDGIHLDYIRQPSARIGHEQAARVAFALRTGVDPVRLSDLPAAERDSLRGLWEDLQREQVTEIVRTVRDSLAAVRAGIVLSAAVVADTARAEGPNAQDWRAWVREGLIDHAFLMCYAPSVQKVMDQLVRFAESLGADRRIVPGIAMYNTAPGVAALKILGARALGYPDVALYSYDSLFQRSAYWTALRSRLDPDADTTPEESRP